MKKQISILIFVICAFTLKAQHSVSSYYNNNGRGQNFDINYSYTIKKKDELSVGFSFLINQNWQNNITPHVYYKNFHAFNFGQRFGYQFQYKHHFIFEKLNNFSIYPFVHLHYIYGQIRANSITPTSPDVYGRKSYIVAENVSYKLNAFTPIIGMGVNVKIVDNISVNLQAGSGFNFIKQTQKTIPQSNVFYFPDLLSAELTYQFSVGLQYTFKKWKKKE